MASGILSVPYYPYLWSRSASARPSAVEKAIDRTHVYEVPDDWSTAKGLLSLYLADLLFLIYPGVHKNAAGETFSNISYYTDKEDVEAFSMNVGGVCRTTVSIGQVRHLVALAVEVYRLVCPILFESEAPDGRSSGQTLDDLMHERHTIDEERFSALLSDYPRQVNESKDSFESEFLLFADMLRFVWCHEWRHGLAGHLLVQEEIARLGSSGTYRRDRFSGPTILVQQALEFEADSVAIKDMLAQIGRGRDVPGSIISFQDGIEIRILWMLLAASVMMTYWYEVEPRDDALGEGRHPAAAFRYLNAWDTVRAAMIRAGADLGLKQFYLNVKLMSVISKLAEACVSFAPLLAVTPLIHETESMRRARHTVDVYVTVLEQLGLDASRYQVDYAAVSEAVPFVTEG